MALRVSGIELVVRNYSQFVASGRGAQAIMNNLGLASEAAQRKIARLGSAFDVSGRKVQNAANNYQKALRRQQAALQDATVAMNNYNHAANAGLDLDVIAALSDAAAEANERLTDANLNLENSFNNLANAQNRQIQAWGAIADAQQGATLQFSGLANALVGLIPGLGKMAQSGQLSIAAFGGMASILPVVGAAFGVLALSIKGAQNVLNGLVGIVKLALNALKGLANTIVSAFKAVGSILEWATRPLRTFLGHVLEIASGIALWRFVRSVGEGIKNLVSQVFEAVAAFQGLEIRLESLAARDYARAFGVPMQEAFEKTAGAAGTLFGWMRKLAVETPFSNQDIAQLFTLSNAMGLSVETTKEATIAIVNFASAFGLPDEVLNRIIYQFGQMIARGKLTGEEMRDLGRNMVPIHDIMKNLAKEAGMNTEAFREMAMEGGVPVMDFLNEFIRIANTDYPDAAKRMARTWQGVTNNLKDFIQTFIGVDVIKPVMDRFTGIVADALDRALGSQELQRGTKLIGQALVRGFEIVTPVIDNLVAAFQRLWKTFFPPKGAQSVMSGLIDEMEAMRQIPDWAHNIGVAILTVVELIKRFVESVTERINQFALTNSRTFDGMARGAFAWGLNFVKAFANGIKGGLQILTAVIGGISQILSYFFKPGSPPRIAPDIDKWGAATFTEWIKGFTSADFDVFNDVTGLIESYLRSLGDSIAKEALIPAILDVRGALAQGLAGLSSGGSISGVMDRILGGVTGGADLFREYLNVLLKVPAAQEAVAAATRKVEDAQRGLEEARARLDAFTESLFGIAEAENAVEVAGARVKAIQDQINEVTDRYSATIENLRSQLEQVTDVYDDTVRLRQIDKAIATQMLTAEERERLEMEKRAIEIEAQIRAVEGQRDLELETLKAELAAAKNSEEAAERRLEDLRAQYEAQRDLLELEVDAAEERLRMAQQSQDDAEAAVELLEDQADAIRSNIEALIEHNNLLQEQKRILEELAAELAGEGGEQLFSPIDVSNTGIDEFLKEIDRMVLEAQAKADELGVAWGQIKDAWTSTGVGDAFGDFSASIGVLTDKLGGLLGVDGNGGILKVFEEQWGKVRDALKIPEGQTFIEWLAQKITDAVPYILIGAQALFLAGQFIWNAGKLLIDIGKEFFSSDFFKNDMIGSGQNFLKGAQDFYLGTQALKNALEILGVSFGTDGTKTMNIVDRFFEILSFFNPAFESFWKGWTLGSQFIAGTMETYRTFAEVVERLAGGLAKVRENFANTDLARSIQRLGDAIADSIWSIFNAIAIGTANFADNALPDWTRDILLGIISDIVSAAVGARARGGPVSAGRSYVVGERRPEVFVPDVNGMIYPSLNSPAVAMPPVMPGGSGDTNYNIEINPTYANTQSEAGIFYDVSAALAVISRR